MALFSLQYENISLGDGVSEFDPAKLRWWHEEWRDDGSGTPEMWAVLEKSEGTSERREFRVKDLPRFQVTDAGLSPESSNARSANSVVALTPPSEDGTEPFDIILLEATATKTDPKQTIYKSHDVYERLNPDVWAIEVFGGHVVFFYWIASTFPKARIIKLKTDTSANAKKRRIRDFFTPFTGQNRFFVHRGHLDFLAEYESFPSGRTVDLLDAISYSPQIWAPPDAVSKEEDPLAGIPEEWKRQIRRDDDMEDGKSEHGGY